MRTDLRGFHLDKFGPCAERAPAAAHGRLPAPLSDRSGVEVGAGRPHVSLDSRPPRALDPKWAGQGVLFGSLDRLLLEHGELLRPHLFAAIVDPGYDKFAALQAACWSGGTLL